MPGLNTAGLRTFNWILTSGGDGEADALGETDELTEELGLSEAEGERLAEAEELGETLAEGDTLALIDELGDKLDDGLILGETEAEGLKEALGDKEALGLTEAEADELGDTEALGDSDDEGEIPAPAAGAKDAPAIAQPSSALNPSVKLMLTAPAGVLAALLSSNRIRVFALGATLPRLVWPAAAVGAPTLSPITTTAMTQQLSAMVVTVKLCEPLVPVADAPPVASAVLPD
jgi:hypothetical protein